VESTLERADRTTPPRVNKDLVICVKQDRFHQYSMLQARPRRVTVYIVSTGSRQLSRNEDARGRLEV
jgi:hypothetical protein